MNPRVLIIAPQVYQVPHGGAGVRAHFQAVHLSRLWPVTLLTTTGMYVVSDEHFTQITAKSVPQLTRPKAYLRSLISRNHYLYEKWNCRYWMTPELDSFSHVIVHFSALLHLIEDQLPSRAKIMLDTHNNDREYYESVESQTANPFKRLVIHKQADRSEQVIKDMKTAISATISVSDDDRDWLVPFCEDGTPHFVVPNNFFRYKPTIWSGRKTILYIGSLNVMMNLQALDWFTTNVWPRLRRIAPEVEFIVAGRDPSATLVARLQQQGITVIPNAPSLTALYQDAMCSLVPAVSGSGGKVKVCESLAYGVPLITTAHGLVGQPSAIKECCVIRDTPDGWLEAIRAQAGRQRRTTVTWDKQVKDAIEKSYYGASIMQVANYIATN